MSAGTAPWFGQWRHRSHDLVRVQGSNCAALAARIIINGLRAYDGSDNPDISAAGKWVSYAPATDFLKFITIVIDDGDDNSSSGTAAYRCEFHDSSLGAEWTAAEPEAIAAARRAVTSP